ncbi:unnamed protein product, partial [Musa acuminata subsp. burmannicoides]
GVVLVATSPPQAGTVSSENCAGERKREGYLDMSRHPEVKWAQRLDKIYITVQLPDAKDAKVNLEPDGIFTFLATAGSGNSNYELKMDLYDKVNKEVLVIWTWEGWISQILVIWEVMLWMVILKIVTMKSKQKMCKKLEKWRRLRKSRQMQNQKHLQAHETVLPSSIACRVPFVVEGGSVITNLTFPWCMCGCLIVLLRIIIYIYRIIDAPIYRKDCLKCILVVHITQSPDSIPDLRYLFMLEQLLIRIMFLVINE